jgi:hypothetical protein
MRILEGHVAFEAVIVVFTVLAFVAGAIHRLVLVSYHLFISRDETKNLSRDSQIGVI